MAGEDGRNLQMAGEEEDKQNRAPGWSKLADGRTESADKLGFRVGAGCQVQLSSRRLRKLEER